MTNAPASNAVPSEQRRNRIMLTEKLKREGSSDIERWAEASSYSPQWEPRAQILARLVRPGERVFEFGAGCANARRYLPAGCAYDCCDLVLHDGVSMRYDLNEPTLAPIAGYDVALFSGVLEYVHDLARLSAFLFRHFHGVVCSYATASNRDPAEIEHRRYSGWFTDLTVSEFEGLFSSAGFKITAKDRWLSQSCYRFDAAY